jgi:putative ABC transport system permease protein
VGHVKNQGPEQKLPRDPIAETYLPYKQEPFQAWMLVARTTGDPAHMAAAVEGAIRSVDRGLPISDVRTMNERVGIALQYRRFAMLLLGLFAAIGLILALVGVYGVMSYAAMQRTHEIGVRMALGAGRADMTKLLLGRAVQQAAIGLGVGFVLSFIISRWLGKIVFGVSPTDPSTFAAVSVVLACAALAAGYIPARRATRVDPASALREQ